MSIVAIKMALDDKLLTLGWITDSKKQVAWDDRAYKPVTGSPYLRVDLLLNDPIDLYVERSGIEERGIYQVSVNYPQGKGALPAMQVAELVRDLFAPVQALQAGNQRIDFLDTPSISSGYHDDDGWYIVPVSISWRAFPV